MRSGFIQKCLWHSGMWCGRTGQIVLCRILVTNDFVSSKQNVIMRCNEQQNGTKMLMSRDTWWRGDRWPEKMSAMATSVDLRSSLRPRSGSFHSVTLRDDCEMTLPHSHITNTCHLSLDFFSGGRSFMCNQTSEQHAEIPRKGRLWRWISKMTTCLLLFFKKNLRSALSILNSSDPITTLIILIPSFFQKFNFQGL